MTFKVLNDVIKNITETVQQTAIGTARALKAHTYSAKIKNFPKTQSVKGSVTVVNQKNVEKELKDSKKIQDSVLKWLKGFKLPKSFEVSNLKEFPKFPEFPSGFNILNFPKPELYHPKNIRISNQPTKEIKEISSKLVDVINAVGKLKLDPKINVEAPKPEKVIVPPAQVSVTQQEIDYKKLASLIPIAEKLDIKKLAEAIGKEVAGLVVSVGGGSGGGGKYAFRNKTTGQPSHAAVNNLFQQTVVNEERWGLNNTSKSGHTTYTGQQDVDGNWIIRKITKTGSDVAMTYATINNNSTVDNYPDAWSNRATLTYDLYQVAFTRE